MTRLNSDYRGMTTAQKARANQLTDVTIGDPCGLDEDGNGVPYWKDQRWSAEDVDVLDLYVANPSKIDQALDDNPGGDVQALARTAEAVALRVRKDARDAARENANRP